MKTLLTILLLCTSGLSQSLVMDPLVTEARTGDVITLIIENADPADSFNIYRKTGVTSAPTLVATIPAQPATYSYSWDYKMPGGTTAQYRFWVAVKKDGVLQGESNVARVKRVK